MQTYSTSDLLGTLKHQTESLLNKAVQDWQMVSPSRFSAQPANGGWSATQCISHLNGYGLYYLPLLEKALEHARQQKRYANTFTPGWLGNYFTALMQPSPDGTATKKMKAPKQNIPPVSEDSDKVIALFIEQHEKLLQLLDVAKGLDLGQRSIPISIAKLIRLKIGDVFRFVIAHNVRHAAQADRALSTRISGLSKELRNKAALVA